MTHPQELSATIRRREQQHDDRWSSLGRQSGIREISKRLRADDLRAFDLFEGLPDELLEELSPDVTVALWEPDAVLFEAGTYIDLAFFVESGQVDLHFGTETDASNLPIFDASLTELGAQPTQLGEESAGRATRPVGDGPAHYHLATLDQPLPEGGRLRLGAGEVFGEIGALSGWPQSVTAVTAEPTRLVQIRLPALRVLKRKSRALRKRLDGAYRQRSLLAQLRNTPLLANVSESVVGQLGRDAELVSFEPGDTIVAEGDLSDDLYLVRSGFVRLAQRLDHGELVVGYLSKGMTMGEVELLVDGLDTWELTATSVEHTDLVRIPGAVFREALAAEPGLESRLWREVSRRIQSTGRARRNIQEAGFTETALESGLVQGTSILVIDLERCTRCDDCVRACAATHDGRARFVREGDRHDNLLIARSCYHCKDPVCLVGCPTGAIHRAGGVATVVEVDERICIGCSVCANNCPYDAIVMHDTGSTWPDDMVPAQLRGEPRAVASKCDLCHDRGHDPACVVNCPQACASRVDSLDGFLLALGRKGS